MSSPDKIALIWGSALIGFAPFICLFFQVTFPKSQLIIVFTSSALFFLLASLFASMSWYILDPIVGLEGPWSALLPGIFFQFIFRSAFVALYHRVEAVIEDSIAKKEAEAQEGQRKNRRGGNEEERDLEAAKLKLELNDVACGLAAGTGFGGIHAILLFGSLLASESADIGVLYQPSCPMLPALLVNAIHCFCFSILDVFWMLFTFFGMRRRLIFPRGGGVMNELNPSRRRFGAYFGNTRTGGNVALLWILGSHTLASAVTTCNYFEYGCLFSLTLLPVITIVTACAFWCGVSKIYTPLEPHSNHRLTLPASMSYGSRAESALNGDAQEDELRNGS